jgi:hypothetical protein
MTLASHKPAIAMAAETWAILPNIETSRTAKIRVS